MEMIFIIVLLPLFAMLPQQKTKVVQSDTPKQDVVSLPLILAVCLMIALYFSRDSSLWSFAQEISVRAGVSNDRVGFILGMTGITGISGAATAVFLSVRWGRFKPLLFGLVTNTLLALWISQTNSAWVFIILEYIYYFVLFFTVPYMYGLAAAIDLKGRGDQCY